VIPVFLQEANRRFVGSDARWFANYKDTYGIDARGVGPVTLAQCKLMVQALFADRFKLKVHRETKELPAYALKLGKDKPKLQEAGENDVVKVQGRVFLDKGKARAAENRVQAIRTSIPKTA
jgi:uncharacterized protein (TIGR03435 family)